MSSTSPNEDISFERNSASASSTLKSPEPAMTTMDNGRRQDLSDIIEEVQVATSAEPITVSANQIGPKGIAKKKQKKTKPKQRGRNTKTTETATNNDTAESTDGIRRSRRPKTSNSQVLVANAYELACQKVMKRRLSPERTKEPESVPNQKSNNRVAKNKKRRIADKSKPATKQGREDSSAVVVAKSKSAVAIGAKSGQLFDKKHICQIAKDLGWFDILCNTKELPTFVNQEGVYKIHTNRSESVKIGKMMMSSQANADLRSLWGNV